MERVEADPGLWKDSVAAVGDYRERAGNEEDPRGGKRGSSNRRGGRRRGRYVTEWSQYVPLGGTDATTNDPVSLVIFKASATAISAPILTAWN